MSGGFNVCFGQATFTRWRRRAHELAALSVQAISAVFLSMHVRWQLFSWLANSFSLLHVETSGVWGLGFYKFPVNLS